ncbi:RES family NAD+ phosphorylase [Microbacterium sp. SGAir0570]|uniref:RES family NAD+ phosphorylase n=1 Tax=Microbacterium sp. SGAir0570 TaxID=2070348 RepID=UPI0015E87511|nr:RES family NAD+ phosphorylase [Microbacterium sp. SGAir0570]
MYRSHGASRDAWYYDNGTEGRFNLHGARGTSCTSSSVDTAVREKVRGRVSRIRAVSRNLAGSFVVAILTERRCAAVNHVDAAKHGIVRELTTMANYSVPQSWAKAFEDAGLDGLSYGSAFD